MSAPRADSSTHLVLGRYRVVRQLGRGGMGVVQLARTEGAAGFARPVVIKRIVPDLAADVAAMQAFAREARIMSYLQHPGIVNVIDFDEEEGAYVMVLEYVHGYTLAQWQRYVTLARGQMSVDHAVYIMIRVLQALHYAHTFIRADGTPVQIVHRDVSPGNVLLDTQGHVKLLDFGIARASEDGEYRTRDGTFKGKLVYAAPEVYEGAPATPRSDVYSAAVVLYQLLAPNPFRARDIAETVHRVLTEVPAPLSSHRSDVTPEFDAVVMRALEKRPEDRYPTASAFADALTAVRPRPESEFVTELLDDIWNDFHGDLPTQLGVEPLQTLDAAWRAEQGPDGHVVTALRSTPPPQRPSFDAATRTVRDPSPTEDVRPSEATEVAPPANHAIWIAIGAVGVLATAGITFAIGSRSPEPARAPRFVVVEKQGPKAAAPPELPIPSTAPPVASAPTVASSVMPPKEGAGSEPSALKNKPSSAAPTDAALLSRRFQAQRGRIEGCFAQHVKEVDGRPEVSIRFQVARSGRVEAAQIAPASLGGTPLGQCLMGVARGTDFGPQAEPVTFSIPITARRVP